MKKTNLLRLIAETGYNVGYGAKKHLATYDIVEKLPGWVAFLSLVAGIYTLFIPELDSKYISATFIAISIGSIFINFYSPTKAQYSDVGSELTTKYHELRFLYQEVKSADEEADFQESLNRLKSIQEQAQQLCIRKQIFLSDWYAHYKFFWQSQTDWLDEQLNFRLFRDKVPLGITVILICLVLMILYYSLPLTQVTQN